MVRIRNGLVVAGLIAAYAGCSSSSGGDNGGGNVPLEQVPALYASAVCDALAACWGPVTELFLGGVDCEERYRTGFSDSLPVIQQGIDEGTVAYDGTKVSACLDAIRSGGCDALATAVPECDAVLDGTVAVGGACDNDEECQGTETYCASSGSCPGTCTNAKTAGGSCAREAECESGLDCENGACETPVGAGVSCGAGEPGCAPGLFCLGADDDAGTPGTCATLSAAFSGALGDPCLLDGEPFCAPDLRCEVQSVDPGTGTIVTGCIAPLSAGSACKISFPDACPQDQYCAVPAQMLDGTCTARPTAGQPCGTTGMQQDVCAAGLLCENGTCRALAKLGETCTGEDSCYSGYCLNGQCAVSGACQ